MNGAKESLPLPGWFSLPDAVPPHSPLCLDMSRALNLGEGVVDPETQAAVGKSKVTWGRSERSGSALSLSLVALAIHLKMSRCTSRHSL